MRRGGQQACNDEHVPGLEAACFDSAPGHHDRSLGADDALAQRYRAILESWQPIALNADIAEIAAWLRASLRFKLADAVRAASALAINAAALVTHDRDFSRVRSLRVIS